METLSASCLQNRQLKEVASSLIFSNTFASSTFQDDWLVQYQFGISVIWHTFYLVTTYRKVWLVSTRLLSAYC